MHVGGTSAPADVHGGDDDEKGGGHILEKRLAGTGLSPLTMHLLLPAAAVAKPPVRMVN